MKLISLRCKAPAIALATVGAVAVSGLSMVGVPRLKLPDGIAQSAFPVRVDRWLQIQQFSGQVLFLQGDRSRAARVGDRLQSPGDGVSTGKNSAASLLVDTAVGTIEIAEDTELRVQSLEMAPDDGRITRLLVNKGQARLRLRPFTNRGSRLEIRTPASLSAVRGTTFGLAVQPNGKTGLAVNEGAVNSGAMGQELNVVGGFQNFTIQGEPPSQPVSLRNDTSLQYEFKRKIERGIRKVQLVGQVDPVNAVLINGLAQNTDREGRFSSNLQPLPSLLRFQVVVITPLGKQQQYNLKFN
jgi:FecR protein